MRKERGETESREGEEEGVGEKGERGTREEERQRAERGRKDRNKVGFSIHQPTNTCLLRTNLQKIKRGKIILQ